jgi:hypothetical protein
LELSVPHVLVLAQASDLSLVWENWQKNIDAQESLLHELAQESAKETLQESATMILHSHAEEPATVVLHSHESHDAPAEAPANLNLPDLPNLSEEFSLQLSDEEPVSENSSSKIIAPEFSEGLPEGLTHSYDPSKAKPIFGLTSTSVVEPVADELTPIPIAKPKAKPVAKPTAFVKSDSQPTEAPSEDQLLAQTFADLSVYFEHAMILLVNGQVARPWKWSESLKTPKSKTGIDLSQPSPFRVLLRTNKSFQGPVRQNIVIDQFCKLWGNDLALNDLTVSPLFVDENFVAILFGSGAKKENVEKESLRAVEAAAQNMEVFFSKNPQIFQAA